MQSHTYDTGSVTSHDLVYKGGGETVDETHGLLVGDCSSSLALVQLTNCECRCSGSGEGKLLLDDVVSSEGDDEEETEETSAGGQGNELANVVCGVLGQQVETVHGWDGRDEEDTQTTGSCCSCLDGTVLLGTKVATEEFADKALLRNELGEWLENCKTEDGTGELARQHLAYDMGG